MPMTTLDLVMTRRERAVKSTKPKDEHPTLLCQPIQSQRCVSIHHQNATWKMWPTSSIYTTASDSHMQIRHGNLWGKVVLIGTSQSVHICSTGALASIEHYKTFQSLFMSSAFGLHEQTKGEDLCFWGGRWFASCKFSPPELNIHIQFILRNNSIFNYLSILFWWKR